MHATGIVPGFAEFTATANVCDGEDYAAVEQAEAIRIEIDRHGDAVAAVTVEEERSGAVAWRRFFEDDGDGDARAVAGYGVETFAVVERRIVSAQDRLLFAKGVLLKTTSKSNTERRMRRIFVGVAKWDWVRGLMPGRGVVGRFSEGMRVGNA